MAEKVLHDLLLRDDGHGQAWVWSVAVKDDAGLQIRHGKADGRLKSQWVPAAKVRDSLTQEALERAQDKLAEGYVSRDGTSSTASSLSEPANTDSVVGNASGDDWFW